MRRSCEKDKLGKLKVIRYSRNNKLTRIELEENRAKVGQESIRDVEKRLRVVEEEIG